MNDSIAGYNIRLLHPGPCPLTIGVGHHLDDPHLEDLGGHGLSPGSLVLLPGDAAGEQHAGQSVAQQHSRQSLLISQQTFQGGRGDLGEGVICWCEDGEVFGLENVNNTRGCGCCDQSREPDERERFVMLE